MEWAIIIAVQKRYAYLSPHSLCALAGLTRNISAAVEEWKRPRFEEVRRRRELHISDMRGLPLEDVFLPRVLVVRNYEGSCVPETLLRELEKCLETREHHEVLLTDAFVRTALYRAEELLTWGGRTAPGLPKWPRPQDGSYERTYPRVGDVEVATLTLGRRSIIYEYGVEQDYDFTSDTWKMRGDRIGAHLHLVMNSRLEFVRASVGSRSESVTTFDEDDRACGMGWIFGRTRIPVYVMPMRAYREARERGRSEEEIAESHLWTEVVLDIAYKEPVEVVAQIREKTGLSGDTIYHKGDYGTEYRRVDRERRLWEVYGWDPVVLVTLAEEDGGSLVFPGRDPDLPADADDKNIFEWLRP
jgi:hypothetical protein